MNHHQEMQAIAAGRAKTYAVLSALFAAPPSADLAAAIREDGLVQDGSGALAAAADELTAFFRLAPEGAQLDTEVAAEHTRLFVLPAGVVPHESYYLDENKRVGGHITVSVFQYYENAAAQLSPACIDLPDHMGVELEFMKFLCGLEAQFWHEQNEEGLRKCLDFQNAFLADHLLLWYRPLCEKVIEETSLGLYRALARLTMVFLDAERAFVPELTEEISQWRETCVTES